ncbi:MAG: PQQ-like beta-propeller repeat protein [Bacteroidales bacterium]|nr:PQQ-like beta-propeller repeat protein [Bacteroidales bacterium]
MKYSIWPLLVLILLSIGLELRAQEVQWRGPNRDGIYPDNQLLEEWPEDGPEVLFLTKGIGRGFSSAVATSEMIYVTGIKDSYEYLTAMDLQGNIVWQKSIGPCWDQSYPETRSTPTVEDDRVYVLSGKDLMVCFHAATGEVIWSVDIHEEYDSRWDMFGVSESVLLVGDKVITTPAGESTMAIALDKMTGKLVWKSKPIGATRSNMSPILIEHCGKEYVIASSQTHMIGVDPENGKILWDYHYNFLSEAHENTTILANTPMYKDSCLWISNGWDVPSIMLEIAPDGRSVSTKFEDRTFDNQNMGVVLVDGFLYGSNYTDRNDGKWLCMNWDTGEIKWIADFHTKGPIIYADGMLYCYEEKRGNMALVKADPEAFEVISTFKVSEGAGPHWARPTIFNQVLYVRHGEVLVAYNIKL